MGTVNLILPDELHQDLKHEAIDQHITLKNLIIMVLQEYINQRKGGKV